MAKMGNHLMKANFGEGEAKFLGKAIGSYMNREETADDEFVWQNHVDIKIKVNPGDEFNKDLVTIFTATPGGLRPRGVRS